MRAFDKGSLGVVEFLLKKGAEIDQAAKDGTTPLYAAAQEGRLKVVQHLLGCGAEINKVDKYGITPLCVAAENGHLDVVQHLLGYGAKINETASDGVTPLYVAAEHGHLEVVEFLLKESAEIDKASNEGFTPLYIAAQNSHSNVGAMLLIYGANFDNVNSYFYKKVIDYIARGIINYDEDPQKKLAFAMGSHKILGSDSVVNGLDDNLIQQITELAAPHKIVLSDIPEKHRNTVQERINELQQEQNTPASYFAARVGSLIKPCRQM